MLNKRQQQSNRLRRKRRIRKKVFGTGAKPRLSVFRSNKEIYAQIVDDTDGATMVSASTLDRENRGSFEGLDKTAQARIVGQMVAKRALESGIEEVVFDRNGFIYHGRVAAVAEGAREGGLRF